MFFEVEDFDREVDDFDHTILLKASHNFDLVYVDVGDANCI